jgi:hypothetical protein
VTDKLQEQNKSISSSKHEFKVQLITIFEIHDVLRCLGSIEAMDNERSFVLGNKSSFDKSLWSSDVHHAAVPLFSVQIGQSLAHESQSELSF